MSLLSGDQTFPDEKMLLILGPVPREGRSETTEWIAQYYSPCRSGISKSAKLALLFSSQSRWCFLWASALSPWKMTAKGWWNGCLTTKPMKSVESRKRVPGSTAMKACPMERFRAMWSKQQREAERASMNEIKQSNNIQFKQDVIAMTALKKIFTRRLMINNWNHFQANISFALAAKEVVARLCFNLRTSWAEWLISLCYR